MSKRTKFQVRTVIDVNCPFCQESDNPWKTCIDHRGKRYTGCRSCGQPQVICPSGAYALSTQLIVLGGHEILRVFNRPGESYEIDIRDTARAVEFLNTIADSLQ